jgi:mannitol-1-phosphate/altronate dehydrogenase
MTEWVTIFVPAGITLLVAVMGACAYRMNRNRQSCRMIVYGWCRYTCMCEQEEETHRDDDTQRLVERHAHEIEQLNSLHALEVMQLRRVVEQLQMRIRTLRNHVRAKT